jgi:ParB family chromosome partitioning protein
MKPKRLGKGLEALIPQVSPEDEKTRGDVLFEVAVDKVHANPFQPRTRFDRDGLEELKQSVLENGIIQPITVRRINGEFELIAGERRLRAVQELGYSKIPAFVMEVKSDDQMLELALVENIQREDLNPIEQAEAFQRLMKTYGLTQETVAKKVGKDRATVANFIRLLKLPEEIQQSLRRAEISMGHARALMGLSTVAAQMSVWKKVLKQGWSVRKVEDVVREEQEKGTETKKPESKVTRTPYLMETEDELRAILGTQVKIKPGSRGGRVEISYYSDEDLVRIVELFQSIGS